MLAIVDYRTPATAINKLSEFADVLPFKAGWLAAGKLEGHPDIFIFQDAGHLVLAPDTPPYVIDEINKRGISYLFGKSEVGDKKNPTSYNCVSTTTQFIHHLNKTDPLILELMKGKRQLHTRQAYTRCSLTALSPYCFITSDRNIEKVLQAEGNQVLFVNPESIALTGYPHGFFGGTNGIYNGSIYFNGSLEHSDPDGRVRNFIESTGLEIINLHDGPLFDGGSIFFLEH